MLLGYVDGPAPAGEREYKVDLGRAERLRTEFVQGYSSLLITFRACYQASKEREVKVIVDYDLCEANARCMEQCPEVFRVEEDDTLTVLLSEIPERLRGALEEVVRLCPRQALRIEG